MENDRIYPINTNQSGNSSDGIGLLSGTKSPSRLRTTAIEPSSSYRSTHSRQNSGTDEMLTEEERLSLRDQYRDGRAQPATRTRRPSPGPSTVNSIIQRVTSMRSPIPLSRFRSTRRPLGRQYATLDEAENDHAPTDVASLAGLGYELRDMSSAPRQQLNEEETEYIRPLSTASHKPDFRAFQKRQSLGYGMKTIGAQIIENPGTKLTVLNEDAAPAKMETSIDRTKTVRHIGQNLAQEKNVIVAMEQPIESVDLSSLEGSYRIQGRSSQTFDGITKSATFVHEQTKSYFFPQDPDIPNWKPFSMSSAYILFLTLLAFTIAGVQEALYQRSLRKAKTHDGLISFDEVADISTGAFFSWKYLPTMVAIVYAVLFSIMDFDIRRLEPYYQLSQPSGARAAASLNLDHLTMFQYFIPFKALRLKQWAVFLSTTGNILASMLGPALQNPSLQFVTNDNDEAQRISAGEKHYSVQVQPVWSRLLSSCYIVIGLILVILFIQMRRKSGLLSDPKGIAGIASMATKSHILQDFRGLDMATRGEIHKRLQHRQFVLYKSSIWQGEWLSKSEEMQESERRLGSPHPLMLRMEAALPFLGFMVFGLVSVPVISLTKARVVPNVAPWLPVLLATMLKLLFSTFEADVRLMEPFYQLSLGNATPQNSLTLDYQATVYGWMPIKAILNGHWLVALVGLASIALDILTVTVSSFSVNSEMFLHDEGRKDISSQDETFVSFWVSLMLSIVILVFVIFTTSLVYFRRRHPFLPREPSTIAAVLAFIFASNMLTDFIDTERLTNRQMEERLKKLNKSYGLGWFRGRDGHVHCAIDEEPMRSRYVHGKPYTMAQAGPLQPSETFYSV